MKTETSLASTIRPRGEWVLIRPRNQATNILLPEGVADRVKYECEVLAVGDGWRLPDGKREPLDIHVGDIMIVAIGPGSSILSFPEWKDEGLSMVLEGELIAQSTRAAGPTLRALAKPAAGVLTA